MDDVPGWGAITGGTIPVRLWTDYMRVATEGMEKLKFPEPAYINKDAAPKQTQRPQSTGGNTGDTPRPTTRAPEPTPTRTSEPTPTPTPTVQPEPTPEPTKTKPGKPTVPVPTLPGPTPSTGDEPQG